MSTSTIERTDTEITSVVVAEESSDPADNAHIVYVPKELGITPQALVLQARIEGTPVTAFCGYTWVPQKNPEGLPVCAKCVDLFRTHGEDLNDRDKMPDA